jgi:hypothetical protein
MPDAGELKTVPARRGRAQRLTKGQGRHLARHP